MFKDMLKFLRNREGYSQSELAKKLGISKSAVSMYELGNRQPDFKTLDNIANLFNVDMNFLLGKSVSENEVQHYHDEDARDFANFLFENPEYRVLFDASRKVRKEDIGFVKELMDRIQVKESDDTGC